MTATAASVIAALHVSQRIKDYGSYAGFACVLGLAVLALLYFAQAREVKRLREWAGRAPERDADLQARVTAQAQQRAAAPQPAPANAAAATAAGAAGAATAAGQAATAKPAQPGTQPSPQPASQPATPTGQPATPAGQPATPAGQPAAKPGVPAPATAAAAATAAGAASASPASASPQATTPPPSTPKPATPAGANGAVDQPTQITPPPAAGTAPKPAPKPGQPLRPPTPAPSPANEGDHEQSPLRTTLMIVGGVLAVIVIAVVLILTVFSGGSSKNSPNTIGNAPATTPGSSSKSGTKPNGSPAPVSRGDVTVAVLNGTTVPGLARGAATRLQNAGFKIGTVTNAPDQARSATFVAYQPGHQAEANVVAKLIHVGTDAVKPIDQSTAVVAGQDAFVVVTVGSDQSQ